MLIPSTSSFKAVGPPSAHSTPPMMVASPLNRPIRVDDVFMTYLLYFSFRPSFAEALCGAPTERRPAGTPRSLLTGSSGRFFPQSTVAFLVLLLVDLAPSETLPQGLLGRALTPGVHAPIEANPILPVRDELDDRPNHDTQHE